MKANNFYEACYIVGKLNPDNWKAPQPEPVSQGDVDGCAEILRSKATLEDFLETLDGTPEDLATLRLLLVAELTLRAREPIATLLLVRHESVLRSMRVAAVLDDHPTLAVYWEKTHATPVGKSKKSKADKANKMNTGHLAGGLFPPTDSKWNKM
jgi:hypothetical protein